MQGSPAQMLPNSKTPSTQKRAVHRKNLAKSRPKNELLHTFQALSVFYVPIGFLWRRSPYLTGFSMVAYTQPSSFIASPECQILVMWLILSPSKNITYTGLDALAGRRTGPALGGMRRRENRVGRHIVALGVDGPRLEIVACVRHESVQRLHPIGVGLKSRDVGQRLGLGRERRVRLAVRRTRLPTLSGFAGLKETSRGLFHGISHHIRPSLRYRPCNRITHFVSRWRFDIAYRMGAALRSARTAQVPHPNTSGTASSRPPDPLRCRSGRSAKF